MDKIFYKDKEKVMKGKLSITKVFNTGLTEKIQEFDNIPVQGLGYSLARLFASKSPESVLDNFRFGYFQLGTDFIDYIPQGDNKNLFYQLASALTISEYGTDIDSTVIAQQQLYTTPWTGTIPDTSSIDSVFVKIPDTRITRIGDSVVKIQIIVDKNMAVGKILQEVGLFIKNPNENLKTDQAILAAYKYFKPIPKTNQYSIVFDWVIQIVDLTVEEDWEVIANQVHYPPALAYDINGFNIDASSGTFNLSPLVAQNLSSNSFGLYRYNGSNLFPADTFTINNSTGTVSFTVISGTNETLGKGVITIRATPTDPSFGSRITADIPYNIVYTGINTSGGTGATGGVGMTGTGDEGGIGNSSGTLYKGPRIGDIDWVVPYTGSQYDYATSQVVVLKAILPTSKISGDFFSSPGLDRWMVEGGTHQFTTASCIAQIHPITRDPSGYPTNVEVVFSALAKQPNAIPDDLTMNYQTFRLFQASGSTPSSNLSLSSLEKLWFQVIDTSGYQYNCKFFTSTAGGLSFNPDNNPSITSSLLKNGPYLKTYRFYGRMVPRGYAGTTGQWDANDPYHEVKPFGPSIHAYVTIRLNQEVANVDFRISNAHIHRRGYAGITFDPIAYESECNLVPNWSDTAHVLGNFYFNSMFVDFGTNTSAISYIDKWDINLSPTSGKYTLVSAFPVASDPNNQPVHCITPTKALVHRFGVFKTTNVSSLIFAKHETKGHYQAYPKINSGRSYQKIRAWGFRGEYLPTFPDAYFPNGSVYSEYTSYGDGIGGIAGQRRICFNGFNTFNDWWKNQPSNFQGLPLIGRAYGPPPRAFNSPWTFGGGFQPGDPGVVDIDPTAGSRQLNEEYDWIEAMYESQVPRQVYMYNVSGNYLSTSEILVENNPNALTDTSGFASYYINNPTTILDSNHVYQVEMGSWISSDYLGAKNWPQWYVRALSNSKKCQPDAGNFNTNSNSNNKCPYYTDIAVTVPNNQGTAWQQHDTAHTLRALSHIYPIALGRNDPMAKEDLQAIAEISNHATPQYFTTPINSFYLNNINLFDNTNYNNPASLVPKCLRVLNPTLSGTGMDIFAFRGSAELILNMSTYYQIANDSWRNRNQSWFDYITSAYSYGWHRESGYVLPGEQPNRNITGGLGDGWNLFTCAPEQVYFKQFIQNPGHVIINPLPNGGVYWLQNPQGQYNGVDGTTWATLHEVPYNQSVYGASLAASSKAAYTFHSGYIMEAMYSLVRSVTNSTKSSLKQSILSSIYLTCNNFMRAPVFGTFSGMINDPSFVEFVIPYLNTLVPPFPPGVTQQLQNALYTDRLIPQGRQRGIAYTYPIGPVDYIYQNHLFGYGSGVGEKRGYIPSANPLGVQGNVVVGDGYYYGSRNRGDLWDIIAMGIAASLGDNDVSLSSQAILSSNYFIQKGPEYLSNDFDVLLNPATSQFFQNSDPNSIMGRIDYGINNLKSQASFFNYNAQGLRQCAIYLAYLLKARGLI